MTASEKAFERELEIFRENCEGAAQFFYGHMAINEVARRHPTVLAFLNRNAMFLEHSIWGDAGGGDDGDWAIVRSEFATQPRSLIETGAGRSSDVLRSLIAATQARH